MLGHPSFNCVNCPFPDFTPILQIQPAHPGFRLEFDKHRTFSQFLLVSQTLFAYQLQYGPSLRRIITKGAYSRPIRNFLHIGAANRNKLAGHPVPVGNGAGLIQNNGINVAGGLYSLSRHGQNIELGDPVHACDSDSR
ncbi:hypothetical protein D3C75_916430 [compost metagenome]